MRENDGVAKVVGENAVWAIVAGYKALWENGIWGRLL